MRDCEARDLYEGFMRKAEERKIPVWAHIDLSYKCNLSCVHCYCQGLSPEFSGGKEELTVDEWKKLLEELAAAGTLYLTISGGEVLLHPGFFEIASYAKKNNFCLSIITNGTLVDEDTADRLKGLAPKMVAVSVYAATADIHDSITGSPGSFNRTVSAVRLLKKIGLRVELLSVIIEANHKQLGAIEDMARALGADDHSFTIEISRKNDGSRDSQVCRMREESINAFIKETSANVPGYADGKYSDNPLDRQLCATGLTTCYISPYGDVYPCIMLLRFMGNVREKSFAEIWRARSALRDELDALKTYGDLPLCRQCEYVRTCKLCMGMAFSETGDIKKCYNILKAISRAEYEAISAKRQGVFNAGGKDAEKKRV